MVLHFSQRIQPLWKKFPKRGKSYEAKGWDIIIFLDLCSPLSLTLVFFWSSWDCNAVLLHNAAKIRQFTCAFCLAPFSYVTKICAFNEFQMIRPEDTEWTENCAQSARKKNWSSFSIAPFVRYRAVHPSRSESRLAWSTKPVRHCICVCVCMRHKTTIYRKIDLEFNWMMHAMRTDNNKNSRRGR